MNSFALSALIPTSGLVRAYPLASDTGSAGDYVTAVADESGSGANLARLDTSGTNGPKWAELNGRKTLAFTGSVKGLTNTTDFTLRDVFALAKHDGSAFDAYRGVVSDNATNPVILSNNSGTKFFDLTIGTVSYRKSGTLYTASTQEAPMNAWALVQMANTASWAMDGLQLGTDRANARYWKGWIGPVFAYSEARSAAERRAIKLWYDLRYQLWLEDGTTLEFPSPDITGILWSRFREVPRDYSSVTVSHVYEDEGRSFNETGTPPRRFEVEFTGLARAEADVFDAFWEAARMVRTFTLTTPADEAVTGVRIESYERDHDSNRGWINSVKFVLAKY